MLNGYSQVGIGTALPDASSQLDVVSDNKGILIPRVRLRNLTDQTTIADGNVESLLVFNINNNTEITPGYYYWFANKWQQIINQDDLIFANGPSITNFNYDNVTKSLTITFEDGSTQIADLSNISGTLTTLVDNGDGSFTYTDEDGTATTYNETNSTLVDNGDGSFTYTDEDGTATTYNETNSTLVDNGNGSFTYTDEDGTATNLRLLSTDSGNDISLGTDGGLFYSQASPVKKVFSAEYAGASLVADGSDNIGELTSDNAGPADSWMNFYQWSSDQSSPNDYDVVLRITLPNSFTSWATNAVVIDYQTETGIIGQNNFSAIIYPESSAAPIATIPSQASTAWTTTTIPGASLSSLSSGETFVIVIKMTSSNNNTVKVGDITLNYTEF